jgi:hypothetical protein
MNLQGFISNGFLPLSLGSVTGDLARVALASKQVVSSLFDGRAASHLISGPMSTALRIE